MILQLTTAGILLTCVYIIIRHSNGDFIIESSEIIKQGRITDERGRKKCDYYIIKTVYKSGRIKLKEKRF